MLRGPSNKTRAQFLAHSKTRLSAAASSMMTTTKKTFARQKLSTTAQSKIEIKTSLVWHEKRFSAWRRRWWNYSDRIVTSAARLPSACASLTLQRRHLHGNSLAFAFDMISVFLSHNWIPLSRALDCLSIIYCRLLCAARALHLLQRNVDP